MDDDNNIFDVLESPLSTSSSNDSRSKSSYNVSSSSMRRSNLPLMNGGAGSYASSSTSPTTSNILPSQSDDEQQLRKKLRVLHGLGFANPGPKNLVNVANVPSRRTKNRQPTAQQEKPSASKPLYDKDGLLVSDQSDRCDCNRLICPGCFLPCSNCHSSKCGLECRNLRTYSYEYRLYGTNKEITQQ